MKPQKFKPIKTERLTLKPWTPSFKLATELYNLIERNREHFRFLPLALVKTPEEEYDFMKSAQKNWRDGTSASFAIYLRGTNTLIGCCSMSGINPTHKRAQIGYWMDKNYTGHGYMTEAVAAMTDDFFARGLNRVYIRANIKNKASWAVAKRLGFTKEDVRRQELWNAYMNEYEDIVCYGKLRSEWKAPRKK